MRSSKANGLVLISLCCLLTGLFGCGSDDDSTGPVVDVDVLAPVVTDISPENGEIGVGTAIRVFIEFSEAMDPATAAGNVTLSAGTITDLTWIDPHELQITQTGWDDGEAVTVTVTTGLKDVAGNALPQAFTSTFYTDSDDPVLLDSEFSGEITSFPTNGRIYLTFSEEMDLLSVFNATTFTLPPPSKVVDFQVGTVGGDYRRVSLNILSGLDPATTYVLTVATTAHTRGGTDLTEPVILEFTTAADDDDTAPYVVSSDAVVTDDLVTWTTVFNEPIVTIGVEIDTLSAMVFGFSLGEPVWNEAGDEMTTYLAGPLPAGVEFFMVLGNESFSDLSGNRNTEPERPSFTTAGTPDFFPVDGDLVVYHGYEEEGWDGDGDWDVYGYTTTTFTNFSGNNFDRVVMLEEDGGKADPEVLEHWLMSESNEDIALRGFVESDGTVSFSPSVNYLPSPIPATWSGSSTGSQGGQSFTLNYEGEIVETGATVEAGWIEGDQWVRLVFTGVTVVDLAHSIVPPGGGDPIEVGVDTIWLCPGLGIVQVEAENTEYDGDVVVGGYDSILWFEFASFNGEVTR